MVSPWNEQFETIETSFLPNGYRVYDLDNNKPNVQALGQGKIATDTITVHSADGTSHQVTVIVHGTNDKAVISGIDTGSVTENSAGKDMSPDYAQPGMAQLSRNPLYVSGALTISDLDTGEAAFNTHGVGFTYSGKFGDLLLQENGQTFCWA